MQVKYVAVVHGYYGIPTEPVEIEGPKRDTYEEAMADLPDTFRKAARRDTVSD